jgi:hypothetical protein
VRALFTETARFRSSLDVEAALANRRFSAEPPLRSICGLA